MGLGSESAVVLEGLGRIEAVGIPELDLDVVVGAGADGDVVVGGLGDLEILGVQSPGSGVLSAVVFDALVMNALIPIDLQGGKYAPATAASLLRRDLLVYGLGRLIVPFVGIKVIDIVINALSIV